MNPGDKVRITSFEGIPNAFMTRLIQSSGIATVSEADPIRVGENGNYHTDFMIYCQELPGLCFGPGQYKKV